MANDIKYLWGEQHLLIDLGRRLEPRIRILFWSELLLEADHFTIIQSTFLKKQVQRYRWQDMGHLHYVGRDKKTDHPLKGRYYDYWGFETHEQVIQRLHQEGSMHFDYKGLPVRFGRNIYSWHAEEIVRMMKLFTGDKLQLGADWRYLMQEHEWDESQS